MIRIASWIQDWDATFPDFAMLAPWEALQRLPALLPHGDTVFVDPSATIEHDAVIKGPAWIGPRALVAVGAYIRGGAWIGSGCVVGPGSELKTSILLPGAKLAHFNFVGDSILGTGVNLEAGAVIANYRNERADKRLRIKTGAGVIETGVDKFGALVGDGAKIGANAVIAPGALIEAGAIVPRLGLIDQSA